MKRPLYHSQQPVKKNGQLTILNNCTMQQAGKICVIFLLAVSALPAFSQWSILSSGVTNTLRAPYFTSDNVGYIVGEPLAPAQAIILKTTDGGLTWASKTSGTTNALRAVHFTDANTGYAVGFTGTILKTTNAGETWTALTSGTTQALRSVYFSSPETGYAAGGLGVMLKTTNAGATWTTLTTGITADLINVRFANNDIGYAVSSTGTFTNGIIIKTINGGATWTTVYTNVHGLLGLAVVDANTVYAGGGNNQGVGGSSYIVKTTNGGTTWTQVYTGLANAAFRGAWFTSANRGCFVGDFGEMPVTKNGGSTWHSDSIQANGLLGVHFPSENIAYAVGALGTILKYSLPANCEKPGGQSVSDIAATAAVVEWDAVAGAVGYKITYHPAGSTEKLKKSSTSTSKKLINLLPETTYVWGVQTICSNSPTVSSLFVLGPNFTTPPLRLGEESDAAFEMEIFPNPAAESATVSFSLSDESQVVIRLMDMNGRVVQEIENATYPQGNHYAAFDNRNLSSGLYLVQLTTNENVTTRKLMIER